MDAQFGKLEAARDHSPALIALARSCLALDPLARPQSVFAVQKVLKEGAPAAVDMDAAAASDAAAAQAPATGWRGLVGRLGALGRKA